MIWAVHILSISFAYFCARHDVPAVDNFTDYGSTPKHQRIFHGANWKLKFCFCVTMGLMPYLSGYSFASSFLLFIVAWLDVWAVFDPVIARTRKSKKVWYYLSEGNATDRILLRAFGKYAGIYKAALCIVINLIIIIYGQNIS